MGLYNAKDLCFSNTPRPCIKVASSDCEISELNVRLKKRKPPREKAPEASLGMWKKTDAMIRPFTTTPPYRDTKAPLSPTYHNNVHKYHRHRHRCVIRYIPPISWNWRMVRALICWKGVAVKGDFLRACFWCASSTA